MIVNAPLTAEELVMAEHLVEALNLDRQMAGAILPEADLFGDHSRGLGLDSIDALEIALMVQRHYGVTLRSDDKQLRAAFGSLRSLTSYVLRAQRGA